MTWTLDPGTYAGTALSDPQLGWAGQIMDAAYAVPGAMDRDVVCALACVAQESGFRMYANDGSSPKLTPDQQAAIRASLNLPHDAVGHDSASVGLFQQQPYIPGRTWGWGTIPECMDVAHSTRSFMSGLLKIADRPNKSVTSLVQQVQRSSFPDAYAKHEPMAWALLNAYLDSMKTPDPSPPSPPAPSGPSVDDVLTVVNAAHDDLVQRLRDAFK